MKPFLVLQLRPIDLASDDEYMAFLKYGGLSKDQVHRVRMDKEGIPNLDLDDYSGIIIGGGPSNVSDNDSEKQSYQKRFENDLTNLLNVVFEKDFPILGICYGIGALSRHQGGIVSKENYSEGVAAVEIEINEAGMHDALLEGLPNKFMAYAGHKEACQEIPNGATVLAKSDQCPIQMIRFRKNIYATQFHTELDVDGIHLRIKVYRNHGYFSPEEAESLMQKTENYKVQFPSLILERFIQKYKHI